MVLFHAFLTFCPYLPNCWWPFCAGDDFQFIGGAPSTRVSWVVRITWGRGQQLVVHCEFNHLQTKTWISNYSICWPHLRVIPTSPNSVELLESLVDKVNSLFLLLKIICLQNILHGASSTCTNTGEWGKLGNWCFVCVTSWEFPSSFWEPGDCFDFCQRPRNCPSLWGTQQ